MPCSFTNFLRRGIECLTPILGWPLAFQMLGDWIKRVLIVVSFLGFGGAFLISFTQLENGSLPPNSHHRNRRRGWLCHSDVAVPSHIDYTPIIWALAIDLVIFGFELNRFGIFGMNFVLLPG